MECFLPKEGLEEALEPVDVGFECVTQIQFRLSLLVR